MATTRTKESSTIAANILSGLHELQAELEARRDGIDNQLIAMDDLIATMEDSSATSRTRRKGKRSPAKRSTPKVAASRKRKSKTGTQAKNSNGKMTLSNAVQSVLKASSKPMGPKDIAAAVKKTGYKSKSSNLAGQVSAALADAKGIKKVGFGKYEAR